MAEKKEESYKPIQVILPKQDLLSPTSSLETPRKPTLEGLENKIQSLANTVSKLIERIDRKLIRQERHNAPKMKKY